jgi:hypothetical protein
MNRIDKLLKLLQLMLQKQTQLETIYGKDGRIMNELGMEVVEMIFDEIGFSHDEQTEQNQIVARELFKQIHLYTQNQISKEECIQKLVETQRMYEFVKQEQTKYVKYGIYSVRSDEDVYQIVRVVNYDLQNIYLCIFRERFDTRPSEVNLGQLHAEFESIPIPENVFASWEPTLIERP